MTSSVLPLSVTLSVSQSVSHSLYNTNQKMGIKKMYVKRYQVQRLDRRRPMISICWSGGLYRSHLRLVCLWVCVCVCQIERDCITRVQLDITVVFMNCPSLCAAARHLFLHPLLLIHFHFCPLFLPLPRPGDITLSNRGGCFSTLCYCGACGNVSFHKLSIILSTA